MTISEVLNFTEIPTVDEGIERFEFHEYESVARTNLNIFGEIRINVEQQDFFTLPSEVFLLFEGRFLKADGTAYANADAVSLTNNDSSATAVLAENTGCSVRQAYIIQKPTTKRTFLFTIPLKYIFGFCDDCNKVIYGFKHTQTLVRKSNYDAIFRLAAAGKGNLDKISLFEPHMTPSDIERINLYKTIKSKVTITVTFRARQYYTISVPQSTTFSWILSVKTSPEKPRYIIVGFRTNNDGDQELNPSIFDHCDLKNMYIMFNQERYPAIDYSSSFPNQ
ncbi:uncharacterized protein LOC136089525 [Hydra vulgaris]|uniref:Uncharacterized protein LOC136089525 n=1 Tax=Hydra vulgaris TaxID=6087 RepID=A0ABM4DBA5_HYDVU